MNLEPGMEAVLHDAPLLAASALGLLALVGAAEGLHRAGWASPAAVRRLVHACTGLVVVLLPYVFRAPHLVYLLAAAFAGINLLALRRGWFRGVHAVGRRSYGTVAFPLALLAALVPCWSLYPGRLFALQTAFLILALCDPFAAYVGTHLRHPGTYRLGETVKSTAGSTAFFVSAFGLGLGALWWFAVTGQIAWTGGQLVAAAALTAAAATATEALSGGGWDNFFIVIAVVVVLFFLDAYPGAFVRLTGAVGAGLLFVLVAYALRLLAPDGAVAGGLLAASVIGLGGWAWAVPSFTFFFLSSLLSRLGKRRKAALEAQNEKGSVRDAGQVYANGGVGWLLLLIHVIFPLEVFYWGFLGAFAAAAADTWATELGTLAPGRPRLITSGRRVPPGTSGAVSGAGTLGALLGACTVWASALPLWDLTAGRLGGLGGVAAVGLGGLAGSLVDSLLGATVQARYRHPGTGEETERAASGVGVHPLVRGRRWMGNDRVNLICTLIGALFAMAVFLLAR